MAGNPNQRAQLAARRAEIRIAVRDACRSRGDTREHFEASVAETLERIAEDADWDGWLAYWAGQYKARRVQAS